MNHLFSISLLITALAWGSCSKIDVREKRLFIAEGVNRTGDTFQECEAMHANSRVYDWGVLGTNITRNASSIDHGMLFPTGKEIVFAWWMPPNDIDDKDVEFVEVEGKFVPMGR